MSQPLLEFRQVDVFYGQIQALKQVSLTVNEGETVALIGANGAGKSTLLMSILASHASPQERFAIAARISADGLPILLPVTVLPRRRKGDGFCRYDGGRKPADGDHSRGQPLSE